MTPPRTCPEILIKVFLPVMSKLEGKTMLNEKIQNDARNGHFWVKEAK